MPSPELLTVLSIWKTPLGGIAIYNISADYYDTDIIYKQTRGGIQFLNPASVH